MSWHLEKLQELLRKIFQFDSAELDFGIYRTLNQKRDRIEEFLTKDLVEAVRAEFGKLEEGERERVESELEELRAQAKKTLGDSAITADGNIAEAFKSTPIAEQFEAKRKQLDEVKVSEATEAEVYNHLCNFFSRYYEDGDFVTRRRYSRTNKYCVPYNGEEVLLHWASRDQYYVKTLEHFREYSFKAGGYAVHFRLQNADVEQENIKGDKRFFVLAGEDAVAMSGKPKELIILFEYRPLSDQESKQYGTRNQQEAIIKKTIDAILEAVPHKALRDLLAKAGDNGKSLLEKHVVRYTKRNTTDYFIHKNLKGFLERELSFFLKNEVLAVDDLDPKASDELARQLRKAHVVKSLAEQIIDLLAQIEDFQRRLFEKKKFVIRTEYCMTLDRVPEEFHDEILENEAQMEEWKHLFALEEIVEADLLNPKGKLKIDEDFLTAHPTLVLDTKFFGQDFKDRLLASFDDLDDQTEGLMIRGENFQALALLGRKYAGRVKCVYIDPPFNSAATEILYKNKYKHSSWLSLIANRIDASKPLLMDTSCFVVAIDENEQERLGLMLEQLFPEHEKTCVTIIHNPGGIQGQNFSYCHEYAYFIFPKGGTFIGLQEREDNPDIRPLRDVSKGEHLRESAANCFYPIYVKDGQVIGFGEVCEDSFHPDSANVVRDDGVIEVYPIDAPGNERKWVFARQSVERIRDELHAQYNETRRIWDIIRTKTRFNYKTVWADKTYNSNIYGSKLLNNILGGAEFTFPKSLYNVRDCLHATTQDDPNAMIFDFFAGSGTTAHAVLDLNRKDGGKRKYVMVEMADYFDTVMKPRIQKIMFADKWKDGKPASNEGHSHIFKYQCLESYEDALNNLAITQPQTVIDYAENATDYFIRYMLEFETQDSPSLVNIEQMSRPFEYKLKVADGDETQEHVVDLVETFNYLVGLHVQQRLVCEHGGRRYEVVKGRVDSKPAVVIWRNYDDKLDLKQEKEFLEEDVLKEHPDILFINGDSHLEGAQSIEAEFKRRMVG